MSPISAFFRPGRLLQLIDRAPLTSALLALIWGIFFIELSLGAPRNSATMVEMGALSSTTMARHEYWRLLTYALLHSGWWHIGLNSFLLIVCGPVVESGFGGLAMMAIVVLGAAGGGLASTLLHLHRPDWMEVGASGAFFALLGSGLMITSRGKQQRSKKCFRVLRTVLITGLMISLLPGISMSSHLTGLAVGLASALLLRGASFSD
jgi:rhomboid protease GluP